jgi:hypothetical protein
MSEKPLDYQRPPRQQRLLNVALRLLQAWSVIVVLMTAPFFVWCLMLGALRLSRNPHPVNGYYSTFEGCFHVATPMALGGILFVLCSLRSAMERSAA